jgi:murein lipoprotein
MLKEDFANMAWLKTHAASVRVVAVILVGGLAASGCVTRDYIDQQFSTVNTRIDQLDAQVQTAAQRADQAAQSAQAANQAAQAAATDARNANTRLDQVNTRIDQIERGPARTPRG